MAILRLHGYNICNRILTNKYNNIIMEVKISLTMSVFQSRDVKELKDPQVKFIQNMNPGLIDKDPVTYPVLFFVVLECSKDYGLKNGGKYTYEEFMSLITGNEEANG